MISNFLQIISYAIVMITGPQILTSILIVCEPKWKQKAPTYLLGATAGIITVSGFAYLTGFTISENFKLPEVLKYILIVLLASAIINTINRNENDEKPKKIDANSNNSKLFILGFALLGFFPTDLLVNLAVGTSLNTMQNPIIYALTFLATTLILLSTPMILMLIFGDKAQKMVEKLREIIEKYSWVLTEILLVLLLTNTITSL